jgi:hypothetical protein
MRPQPLIVVTDVEASNRWYQRLLGYGNELPLRAAEAAFWPALQRRE